MLTVFQRGFIALVRAGVLGVKQQLPDGFEKDLLYEAAKLHHLIGIVYKGALLCGIDKELPVMKKLFVGTLKEATVHERQLHEYEKIKAKLNECAIEYMPIKGVLIKELYPEPSLRYMNDVDILIHKNEYKKIKELLVNSGYTFHCESDHEYIWIKKGVLNLELHKSLVASINEDFYGYFGDGWKKAVKKGNFEYGMKKEDEFIFLFCHFTKHYRVGGVGVKYIIDLWLYLKNRELDYKYIENELKNIGVLNFYYNIKKVMAFWFEDGENDEMTEFVSKFIILSGAYGRRKNEIASLVLLKKAKINFKTTAKAKLFVMRAFPTLSVMKVHYKYLEKVGILLPFAWVCRWLDALINKRKNIKRHINDIKRVNDKEVEELRRRLEFVGLDFNFKE